MALGMLLASAGSAGAATQESPAPDLDNLLKQFGASAPEPQGKVNLDAWIDAGTNGPEVVILVQPEGKTKLIADPGITVTPVERPGLEWRTAVPYRRVDPALDYFQGPATLRLPFSAKDDRPIELRVEYAYCVVDYQCFFGEATLTAASRGD